MSLKSSTSPEITYCDGVYPKLLNQLPFAVYVCDLNGFVRYYNDAAAVLWGHRLEIGKDYWYGSCKVFSSDNTPIPPDHSRKARILTQNAPDVAEEIIIEQPDGRRIHVLTHLQPALDEMGATTGFINVLMEISDKKNLESVAKDTEILSKTLGTLKNSEQRYQLMISEIQDYAIILLSKDGIIEEWNSGAEKIKGYTAAEAVGQHVRIFYTPEDQASALPEKLMGRAVESGRAYYEGWRVRKDGSRFWATVSLTALHGSNGDIIGFSKVTRDLTERRNHELAIQALNEGLKRNNELLRQSEQRYYRMVSEVEDYVIILLDAHGLIQNWNKGAEKIKGYKADEILGKHFSVFYSQEDRKKNRPQQLLQEAIHHGKAIHEGWRLRKDGSAFWGNVVITALHDSEDNIIGFTKVTRDLTEKKLAEERQLNTSLKLEQKNKELERINEELSSFAYISSHDLQEPLRKIQTFSDRILELEYDNLSEKGKDYFRRMQGGAARMQKLIRDILAYSRTTTSEKKLELTNLNDLLAQSKVELEVMILEKKAVIEADTLPTIQVIPYQVQQLFNNLLNNALKFSRKDVPQHIVIRSEIVSARVLPDPSPLGPDTYFHLTIQDNGIGFEPEYEKKIFEVFQRLHGRTEYGGTGIGLAICKKIVENHNGYITANGRPGAGAKFHVYLPVL